MDYYQILFDDVMDNLNWGFSDSITIIATLLAHIAFLEHPELREKQ